VSITVLIPPPLRKFTGGADTAQFAAVDLSDLFKGLESKFPGIREALCSADGTPHRFLNIYVNDEDIRFLGGAQYAFKDGDEVLLVPAIAGGAEMGDSSNPATSSL
jgi:sulfur-carrier protein